MKETLSFNYRAMIYFSHSTMVIYDKDIVSNKDMTVREFREKNPELIKRVFDECLSVFNYELSYEQISRACSVYLISKYNPKSVKETVVYTF